MSETPNDASQRPHQPDLPEPTFDETLAQEMTTVTDGATVPDSAPSDPTSPEAETDRLPIPGSPSDALPATPAPERWQRPDRVAPSMAIGVMVLLLICTALLLAAA